MVMNNDKEFKSYLGDSVYARFDGYHIILYLDNGYGPHREIALDPNVISNFNEYVKRLTDIIEGKTND